MDKAFINQRETMRKEKEIRSTSANMYFLLGQIEMTKSYVPIGEHTQSMMEEVWDLVEEWGSDYIRDNVGKTLSLSRYFIGRLYAMGWKIKKALPESTKNDLENSKIIKDVSGHEETDGYLWEGMKKITFEEAIKKNFFSEPLFLLYSDGTEAEAQTPSEIVTHYENGGEFGIEKEKKVFRLIFNDRILDDGWDKAYEIILETYDDLEEDFIRTKLQEIANQFSDEQECSEEGIRKILEEFKKSHHFSYEIKFVPTVCFGQQKFTD